MCPIMSMLSVAILLTRELDGVGMGLLGMLGVEVAEKSSAFRRLVLWLSDTSSSLGFRYWSVGGVDSMLWMDLCDVVCSVCCGLRP